MIGSDACQQLLAAEQPQPASLCLAAQSAHVNLCARSLSDSRLTEIETIIEGSKGLLLDSQQKAKENYCMLWIFLDLQYSLLITRPKPLLDVKSANAKRTEFGRKLRSGAGTVVRRTDSSSSHRYPTEQEPTQRLSGSSVPQKEGWNSSMESWPIMDVFRLHSLAVTRCMRGKIARSWPVLAPLMAQTSCRQGLALFQKPVYHPEVPRRSPPTSCIRPDPDELVGLLIIYLQEQRRSMGVRGDRALFRFARSDMSPGCWKPISDRSSAVCAFLAPWPCCMVGTCLVCLPTFAGSGPERPPVRFANKPSSGRHKGRANKRHGRRQIARR